MYKELLAAIGRELSGEGVAYMIIGGQAVLLHGDPRLTRDIDVALGVSTERLSDIVSVASNLSLKPLVEDLDSFVGRTMVLPTVHEDSGVRVDFIFSLTPYEQQAMERAWKVKLEDTEVNFASPEDLVIHKIFSHRAIDLEDINGVLRKNPEMDLEYVRTWLREFERTMAGEKYLAILDEIVEGRTGR